VYRIFDNSRPRLIGLAEGHSVGMAGATVPPQGFVRQFGDVGATHRHGNASGAKSVRCPVSARDHPSHRADPNQTDVLAPGELDELGIGQGLRIAVNQQYLMAWRRARLKQKHPKVRHEIAGHAVVGVVKQDSHSVPVALQFTRPIRIRPENVARARRESLTPQQGSTREAWTASLKCRFCISALLSHMGPTAMIEVWFL
jgi:hypothetical protein